MRLIHAPEELRPGARKVCLAIGFFDGVHLGHQQIIRQTIADARQHDDLALVLTFDRHPNTVVAPDRVPPLIYPLAQKLRTIGALDADALLLLHFDTAFSRQPGEEFIRSLARHLGSIRSICVGSHFVFGHRRSGNVALLQKLGVDLHFTVHGMAAVALDGKPVSSTRIRAAIRAAQLDAASQMLGRPYSVAGPVISGDRLGRQLGFPTANLDPAGLALPPNGVYAARVLLDGQTHRAVANIGHRPTLQNPTPPLRLETHLLDFSHDLYGREIELVFVERLRDETRFPSLDALRDQIARDILLARTRL